MNIDFDTLSEIADAVGGRPYPNYSGRGMYGRTCAGVVINDTSDLVALGHAISANIESSGLRDRMLLLTSTDSLGRGVIAYWTQVTCEDAPEEDED